MATSLQVVPLYDTQKSALSLLLSLSPLYFLVSARAKLGLDGLHVGLLQVLLLLVLRAGLDLIPSGLRPTPAPAPASQVIVDAPRDQAQAITIGDKTSRQVKGPCEDKQRSKRRRIKAAPPAVPLPAFPASKLDETVANFIHITAPAFLSYSPVAPTTSIPSAPLSEWKSTYHSDNVEVLQHPMLPSLFGICATFPDVPIRQLFQVLQDVGSRAKWDNMSQGADEIERFEVDGRKGNCLHMRMKGMAMVKAKDLVLLSVVSRLPTEDDPVAEGQPVADKLRVFAATTSVSHARVPVTAAYNRMQLSVSGFMIEEVGSGGSKIIQITDLSGLGSWIPGAVLRTITQTMLPKSLVKLGLAAATVTQFTAEFPPPTLGVTTSSSPLVHDIKARVPCEDDVDDASSLDDSDDSDVSSSSASSTTAPTVPSSTDLVRSSSVSASASDFSSPAASRDVHFLIAQLRSITSRLAALETMAASPDAHARRSRPWYAFGFASSGSSSLQQQKRLTSGGRMAGAATGAGANETSTVLLGPGTLGALVSLGSAAAATLAVAAVAAWAKRRR